eukprot:symbB.v1.2.026566.t1/scaffold2665.1/size82975/3
MAPMVPTSTTTTIPCASVVPTSTTSNISSGGAKRQFMNPKSFQLIYNFKGDFKINGRPMILTVDPPDSAKLATGLRIWDGGIVLAKCPKLATITILVGVLRRSYEVLGILRTKNGTTSSEAALGESKSK